MAEFYIKYNRLEIYIIQSDDIDTHIKISDIFTEFLSAIDVYNNN